MRRRSFYELAQRNRPHDGRKTVVNGSGESDRRRSGGSPRVSGYVLLHGSIQATLQSIARLVAAHRMLLGTEVGRGETRKMARGFLMYGPG